MTYAGYIKKLSELIVKDVMNIIFNSHLNPNEIEVLWRKIKIFIMAPILWAKKGIASQMFMKAKFSPEL